MNLSDVPVVFDERLRHGEVIPLFSKVYAHCKECLQEKVDECNRRYAIVRTDPPCLLNKETGELEEMPEDPRGFRFRVPPRLSVPDKTWLGY